MLHTSGNCVKTMSLFHTHYEKKPSIFSKVLVLCSVCSLMNSFKTNYRQFLGSQVLKLIKDIISWKFSHFFISSAWTISYAWKRIFFSKSQTKTYGIVLYQLDMSTVKSNSFRKKFVLHYTAYLTSF